MGNKTKKTNAEADVLQLSARRWQITINNVQNDVKSYLDLCYQVGNLQYGCANVEYAPTTGHKHIHIYADFVNQVKGSSIAKVLKGGHIECCAGSQEQNVAYCKKQGEEFCECGELRPVRVSTQDCASRCVSLLEMGVSPFQIAIEHKDLAEYVVNHFVALNAMFKELDMGMRLK